VARFRAKYTLPYAPLVNHFIISKSTSHNKANECVYEGVCACVRLYVRVVDHWRNSLERTNAHITKIPQEIGCIPLIVGNATAGAAPPPEVAIFKPNHRNERHRKWRAPPRERWQRSRSPVGEGGAHTHHKNALASLTGAIHFDSSLSDSSDSTHTTAEGTNISRRGASTPSSPRARA
jgi:hypothetical protein